MHNQNTKTANKEGDTMDTTPDVTINPSSISGANRYVAAATEKGRRVFAQAFGWAAVGASALGQFAGYLIGLRLVGL